jgi:hypothetical protein
MNFEIFVAKFAPAAGALLGTDQIGFKRYLVDNKASVRHKPYHTGKIHIIILKGCNWIY